MFCFIHSSNVRFKLSTLVELHRHQSTRMVRLILKVSTFRTSSNLATLNDTQCYHHGSSYERCTSSPSELAAMIYSKLRKAAQLAIEQGVEPQVPVAAQQ